MPVAPRTIGFLCEVLHPPQAPDPVPIQRIHDAMFRSGDPTYRNFAVTHEGCQLSNPTGRPGAQSQVAFLTDRMRFVEEHTGLTVDDFAGRVRNLVEQVVEARRLPILAGQVVTIRTLVSPRNPSVGAEFMRLGLLRLGAELEAFGRPAAALGLRLVFTPTQERPNAFVLRVESLPGDPRSLWIEVQGTFAGVQTAPADPEAPGLRALEDHVHAAYAFATSRTLAFLERFEESRA